MKSWFSNSDLSFGCIVIQYLRFHKKKEASLVLVYKRGIFRGPPEGI